jgi:peptidoglycan hydrolase CwlO-like protein
MPQKTVATISDSKNFSWRRRFSLLFSGVALGAIIAAPIVNADTYQQQITTLNDQNNQSQSLLSSLQSTATSYQGAIYALQSQISAIQTSIATNQAVEASDNAKIASDNTQIIQNKAILSDDIKTMYVDGQMSTIEELASSKNLSDYVDAKQYRSLIQEKVTGLLQNIQVLETAAQVQRDQVVALLSTEKSQQADLSADQAQQTQLLNANQSQQDAFNQQITANNAQIGKLKAEQAAANASIARAAHVVGASGGAGGLCDIGQGNGGYPTQWCNVSQDSINDSNGFPVRECTSYAYWYFTSVEGQTSFRVSGNAGWWWETSNYPVTTYPDVQVGALGIEPSSSLDAPVPSLHGGYYGHVMVVKALPGQNYPGYGTVPSGYVLVASMNEDEAGHFMYNLWPVNYLMYINPR